MRSSKRSPKRRSPVFQPLYHQPGGVVDPEAVRFVKGLGALKRTGSYVDVLRDEVKDDIYNEIRAQRAHAEKKAHYGDEHLAVKRYGGKVPLNHRFFNSSLRYGGASPIEPVAANIDNLMTSLINGLANNPSQTQLNQVVSQANIAARQGVNVPQILHAVTQKVTDVNETLRKALLREARKCQICFIMDATASMNPHMTYVRNTIDNIVTLCEDELQKSTASSSLASEVKWTFELAFVSFTDGEYIAPKNGEVLDFTDNVATFKRHVQKICDTETIKQYPSNDTCEDLEAGVAHAAELSWKLNVNKLVVVLTDEPCHGREFSGSEHQHDDDNWDSFPGHGGTMLPSLSQLMSHINAMLFVKLKKDTDTMIQKFKEAHPRKFHVLDTDQSTSNSALGLLALAISKSLSMVASNSVSSAMTAVNPILPTVEALAYVGEMYASNQTPPPPP